MSVSQVGGAIRQARTTVAEGATIARSVLQNQLKATNFEQHMATFNRESAFSVRNAFSGVGRTITDDAARGAELTALSTRQAERAHSALQKAANAVMDAIGGARQMFGI